MGKVPSLAVFFKNGWGTLEEKVFFLFCFPRDSPFGIGCTNVTLLTTQR
jgi:hypothetical protein